MSSLQIDVELDDSAFRIEIVNEDNGGHGSGGGAAPALTHGATV